MTKNNFCPIIKGQCKGEQCVAWNSESGECVLMKEREVM